MLFTFLGLSFEFEFHGSIFRTLTPGQRKLVMIKTNFQHFCKFANNDWIEWLKGREILPRCVKQKSKFLYVYDYHFLLFSFFQKKIPSSSFSPFVFFHSHFYLLNLFRLGCFFWKFQNLQSLVHINHVWNAQNCFFFHFYCKHFLRICNIFTPFTKSSVPWKEQKTNWNGKKIDINQCQTKIDKLTKRIEEKQQSQRLSKNWPINLSIEKFHKDLEI